MSAQDIKEVVKERYGAAARRVTTGEGSSCCGAECYERGRTPMSARRTGLHALALDAAHVAALVAALVGIWQLLYWWVGDAVVCYRCGAVHTQFTPAPAIKPFDLGIAERYRQERIRREQLQAEKRMK